MKIALGSDHAGFHYKEKAKDYLQHKGYEVQDFGTDSDTAVDYPDFIRPAAQAVADDQCQKGVVFGGSGNGEAIVANKVRGIRCAVCWNEETARLATEHNNANVISIGERTIGESTLYRILDAWLNAEFQGGRHERRINKIEV